MDTYRVRHKKIGRTLPDGTVQTYEVGEEILPTEDELRAFGDKLVAIETEDPHPAARRGPGRPPKVDPDDGA